MFGIWDSRTDNFYSVTRRCADSLNTLEETLADLNRRGVWFEEASDDYQDHLFETPAGRGRGLIGYTVFPNDLNYDPRSAGLNPYTLALVSIT